MKINPKFSIIASMIIFGTIGVFRRFIPFSSGIIAFSRGVIGVAFLSVFLLLTKRQFSFNNIKKDIVPLLLSGACIGFNWILLFEAYNFTTVATATLCYYMQPVFVIAVSPFILKEKINIRKILCVLFALVGMVFVSGVLNSSFSGLLELKGIALGIGAAILYATVIIINKKFKFVDTYERTVSQLFVASVILIPYLIFIDDFSNFTFDLVGFSLLLVVGIIHTGLAYTLYFGSMKKLKAQTVAIFSYIDPVVAVLLSALFLHEKMTLLGFVGAILILGSAFICDLPVKENN